MAGFLIKDIIKYIFEYFRLIKTILLNDVNGGGSKLLLFISE